MIDFSQKSDKDILKFLENNQSALAEDRRPWEPFKEALNKLYRPRRYDFLRLDDAVEQFGAMIFDGTPQNLLTKFVYGFLGYNVSRAVNWIGYQSPWSELNEIAEVQQYMFERREQVLSSFNRSNFYDNIVPFGMDANCEGDGFLIPREDLVENKVDYQPIHPGECYPSRDFHGNVSVLHRKFKMQAVNAYKELGRENVPAKIVKAVEGGLNPFQQFEFLHCLYDNKEFALANGISWHLRPWVSFYVCLDAPKSDPNRLCEKAGLDFGPLVWSPGREPTKNHGTSIAADGFTEAAILNKLGEKKLRAAHLAVEPVVKASRSLRSQALDMNPGGKVWVKQGEEVEFLGDRLNWPISNEEMNEIRLSLSDKFFVRFFEMLSGSNELPQMTAFQVNQMMGEKAVLMSPMLGTFDSDVLVRAVAVQEAVETAAGRMPDIPGILLEAEFLTGLSSKPQIQFTGPLAQLQRSLLKSKGIIDSLSLAGEIGAMLPNSLRIFKEYDLMRQATTSQGMEPELMNTNEEMRELDQAIAEQREEQEQQAALIEGAKATPAAGTAIEQNSPLALAGVGNE